MISTLQISNVKQSINYMRLLVTDVRSYRWKELSKNCFCRCTRCRCPNCTSPTPPRNNGKKEHICHFPNCRKVYGKTSHLKVSFSHERISSFKKVKNANYFW